MGYSPWVGQSQTQLKQLRIRARGRWKRHPSRVHLDPDQDPVTGEWSPPSLPSNGEKLG